MAREQDHLNLTTFAASGVAAFAPREPILVRARINAIIGRLRTSRRGGTLYIPRVAGGQLWIDVTAALRIPRDITVSLAPGVVLVPVIRAGTVRTDEHHLEIEGVLDAPIATIFATPGWFSRHPLEGSTQHLVGRVRLTSPHLERVHPEWWGAGGEDDPARPSDDEALEATLRAALLDRVGEVTTSRLPLRALAVELRGSYTLARTLRVTATTAGAERGLELRGVAGADTLPTFRCGEGFSRNDPMLLVEGMKGVVLDDLRLDGEGRPRSCLAIQDAGGDAAERAHLLRRCSFHGARVALVSYAVLAPSSPAETVTDHATGIRFEHCTFRTSFPSSKPGPALELSGPPSATVDLRGCMFRGVATAMIHATRCTLTVASCHFHNTLVPLLPPDATSSDALHPDGPSGGVDLYLDGPDDAPIATAYAQDCRSTSPQFLVTRAGGAGAEGNVTVVGLHYTRDPSLVLGRYQDIYVHEDRPRWFVGTIQLDPIILLDAGASKLGLPPKVGLPSKLDAKGILTGIVLDDKGRQKGGDPGDQDKANRGVPFAPILWRSAREGKGRLIVMGCRFDFSAVDRSLSVRGTPGASEIVDLGALRGDGRVDQIDTDDPRRRIEIPTWPQVLPRRP